ncbi:MAG: ATP-binding protein [Candidatus Omnitrophota bacterium]
MLLKKSLYTKIIIFFLVVAFVPLLTVSYLFYRQEKDNTLDVITQGASNLIETLGIIVDTEISDAVEHIRLLAGSHLISSTDVSLEDKTREMQKLADLFRAFDDISLIDPSGVILATLKYDFRGDWRHKAWFKAALKGKIMFSPVHVITHPTKFVMVVTAPVFGKDGEVIAVLAGRIGLERIWEVTDKIRIGNTGFVFITDANGKIVSIPDKEKILSKIKPDGLQDKLLARPSGIIEFTDEDKTDKICFYTTLDGSQEYRVEGWRLGIIQDKDEVYSIIHQMKKQLTLIVLASILIIGILALILTTNILRPIKSLARASETVARGNLETEVKVVSKDEIGDLGLAFNTMVHQLKKSTVSIAVLENEQKRFKDIAANTGDWIWEVDAQGRYTYSSPLVEKILGYAPDEVLGRFFYDFFLSGEKEALRKAAFDAFGRKETLQGFLNRKAHKDGRNVIIETFAVPVLDATGGLAGYRGVDRDITERKHSQEALETAFNQLKTTQAQLIQSSKMATVGILAGGVAHEINNPVGFISSNMDALKEYVQVYTKILQVVDDIKKHIEAGDIGKARLTVDALNKFERETGLDFIRGDITELLKQSSQGLERIKKIVLDLRVFSRDDHDASMETAQIEEVIEDILKIVHNEIKYKAELSKDYGDTPAIRCYPQRLGQVFLNILVNACHAIVGKGKIHIKTYAEDRHVCVDITDTGTGIAPETVKKIFDPFFTTKPIGQGTGLGLSICYEIIKNHGGTIEVKSTVGDGTTFTVKLPQSA